MLIKHSPKLVLVVNACRDQALSARSAFAKTGTAHFLSAIAAIYCPKNTYQGTIIVSKVRRDFARIRAVMQVAKSCAALGQEHLLPAGPQLASSQTSRLPPARRRYL